MLMIRNDKEKEINKKIEELQKNVFYIRTILNDHGEGMNEFFKVEVLKALEVMNKDLYDLEKMKN